MNAGNSLSDPNLHGYLFTLAHNSLIFYKYIYLN